MNGSSNEVSSVVAAPNAEEEKIMERAVDKTQLVSKVKQGKTKEI